MAESTSTSLHNVAAGGLVFSSAFDGGNAARVEVVEEDSFALWTRRDCEGTEFETGCRTWFSFSVRGAAAGRTLTFDIHNMNSQGNLYKHDMRPVYRSLPSKPEWERLSAPASYSGGKNSDKYREMRENRAYDATPGHLDGFVVRFEHTVETDDEALFFAFCFPFSYADQIARLAWLDAAFELPPAPVRASSSGAGCRQPSRDAPPADAARHAALVATAEALVAHLGADGAEVTHLEGELVDGAEGRRVATASSGAQLDAASSTVGDRGGAVAHCTHQLVQRVGRRAAELHELVCAV